MCEYHDYEVLKIVTAKGNISKRVYSEERGLLSEYHWMKCEDCGERYPWGYDKNGRIIRN